MPETTFVFLWIWMQLFSSILSSPSKVMRILPPPPAWLVWLHGSAIHRGSQSGTTSFLAPIASAGDGGCLSDVECCRVAGSGCSGFPCHVLPSRSDGVAYVWSTRPRIYTRFWPRVRVSVRLAIALLCRLAARPVGPLDGLRPFGRGRSICTVWRASHAGSNGSYRLGIYTTSIYVYICTCRCIRACTEVPHATIINYFRNPQH
jgi:hypothetical protein